MKGGKRPLGYTIIEVMIVLAVSGVMFLIATTFINGKQERTIFAQGTNEMASRLQDVIEQVTDGRYSGIQLNCTYNGTTSFGGTTVGQGTNSNCVFLGKILHFSDAGIPYNYDTFSIAGGRVGTGNVPVVSLSGVGGADPKVIPALITSQVTPSRLHVTKVTVTDMSGSVAQSFAVGFLQGQGAIDTSGSVPLGSLQDGPQTINMYYVNGVVGSMSQLAAEGQIAGGGNLVAAQKVDICLTDSSRYADVVIDTKNSQLNVNVQMDGTTPCP